VKEENVMMIGDCDETSRTQARGYGNTHDLETKLSKGRTMELPMAATAFWASIKAPTSDGHLKANAI
jgi:hypothetical protein